MKTLSVKQPWASLICSGVKDIENRTWKTNFRGRVLIHASAKSVDFWDSPLSGIISDFISKIIKTGTDYSNYQNSAIIGSVEIVDCVINHPSIWAEKTDLYDASMRGEKPMYNWILANPILFDNPIENVKGKLSFWDYELPDNFETTAEEFNEWESLSRKTAE